MPVYDIYMNLPDSILVGTGTTVVSSEVGLEGTIVVPSLTAEVEVPTLSATATQPGLAAEEIVRVL